MSGICGIVGAGDDVREGLARIMEAGRHRGQHGASVHNFAGAALGHLRLDLQQPGRDEGQPLGAPQRQLWITFDGEIQNADELAEAVRQATAEPVTGASFPRLALAAYAAFGPECLDHMDGIFAFAIWDDAAQALFCARDRIGIKPFFYAHWRGHFAFASEITQLLALPGFPRRPNEAMVADYLASDISLREDSFFDGIHRLPAGKYALVRGSRIDIRQYWDIDPFRRTEFAHTNDYAERFRELLLCSVEKNMKVSAPTGSALSGGLDTSSIVCLADQLRRGRGQVTPMETFSLAFEDKLVDEGEHVQAVGAVTNIRHNQYYADNENVFSHLRTVQQRQAEPFRSLGIVLFWRMKQLAAAKGIRVLLNGMGADEVLGGINLYYLADLLREGRWGVLARTLDALVKHDPYALHYSRAKYLKIFGLKPQISPTALWWWKRLRGHPYPEFIAPEFARRIQLDQRMVARRHPLFSDHFRQIAYEGVRHHYTALLLHYEDTNNAEFGIESRFPFLDRALVEFLFSIPREQKVADGFAKIVLRNGMRGILPDSVRNRTDKGFIDRRVDHWLGHQYKDMVQSVFSGRALTESGWLDMSRVQRMYRQYQVTGQGRFTIWKCFNLGLWLETFFDKESCA